MNKLVVGGLLFLGLIVVLGLVAKMYFRNSATPPTPATTVSCKIAGCSSQLCVNSDSPNTVTTCEYNKMYACYKDATCEVQTDGECGWTMDENLKTCLGSFTAK